MGFKAGEHKDKAGDFGLLPLGDYQLALVKSERRESNTAGNYYLNLTFRVVKGEFTKRVIFVMLNLKNSNQVAQDIAEGQLAGLMLAVGVDELEDKWNLTSLMNKPFSANVGIQKSKDPAYADKNEIKKYHPNKGESSKKSANTGFDFGENTGEKKKKKKKKKKKDKKE